jgi:PAS domain S-box-containing protein
MAKARLKQPGNAGVEERPADSAGVQEALKESEEKARLLVKYAPSMIYEVDFNGPKFLSVNDVTCETLGYTRKELLAKSPFDILTEESGKIFKERMGKYMAGEKVAESIEYTARTKSGEIVYGLLNVNFTKKDGKPVGAVAVAQDITERRKMEQKLKDSEEMLRLVLDTCLDGICRFNYKTGLFDYLSPSVGRLLGYSMEELQNWDAAKVHATIHPDDVPAMLAAIEVMEQTGEAIAEYREKRKDGTYVWLSNHMSLVRDNNGQPLYRNGNLRDISERKQKEEELRKTNAELAYFNKAMVGRELRMIELKKEIDQLCVQFGQQPRYGQGVTATRGTADQANQA